MRTLTQHKWRVCFPLNRPHKPLCIIAWIINLTMAFRRMGIMWNLKLVSSAMSNWNCYHHSVLEMDCQNDPIYQLNSHPFFCLFKSLVLSFQAFRYPLFVSQQSLFVLENFPPPLIHQDQQFNQPVSPCAIRSENKQENENRMRCNKKIKWNV